MLFGKKSAMVSEADALPGRSTRPFPLPDRHFVNGNPLEGPFPEGFQQAVFGLGCFWGAERKFWETPGVYTTAAGYAGGYTPNPTYEEVCSGRTGHAEVVLVVYDPTKVTYEQLLKVFWEEHDPTQGMRQGNDAGTQYRSAIYTFDAAQRATAEASRDAYAARLHESGLRRHHDRDRRRRRVLLRRGLSPAVSGEGSERLLRDRRNGRVVSRRRPSVVLTCANATADALR